MQLHAALARALKIIPRDKKKTLLRHVLLCARAGGRPARVVAGDGEVWTSIRLNDDIDTIDGALSAEHIVPVLRDIRRIVWAPEAGRATLILGAKGAPDDAAAEGVAAQAEVPVLPRSLYPDIVIPEVDYAPVADAAFADVLYAVGGDDPVAPHWGYVHASAAGLAAGDGYRLALVQHPLPWRGLLSAQLFAAWPLRPAVGIYCDESRVQVQLDGDEIRLCSFRTGAYPDLWDRVHALEPYRGQRLIVPIAELRVGLKQAMGKRGPRVVLLTLGLSRLFIESYDEPSDGSRYRALVDAQAGAGQGVVELLVDATWFEQALKGVRTPHALLGFGGPTDPLRIESGRYLACLWPMLADPDPDDTHRLRRAVSWA